MKILIICPRFPLVSETFVLNHITGLIELGHTVELLAKSKGSDESGFHPEVNAFRLLEKTTFLENPSPRRHRLREAATRFIGERWCSRLFHDSSYLKRIPLLEKGFQKRRLHFPKRRTFDIIHAHFGPGGLLGLHLKQLGEIQGKLVVSFHGFDLSRELRKTKPIDYGPLFRGADFFLPVSAYFKRRLETLGCPTSKITVHPVAVDLSKFRSVDSSARRSGLKLISVARLVEKKGLEYSIRAVALLLQRGFPIQYEIIGNGDLYSKLSALIKGLGVSKQIRLLGAKLHPEVSAHLSGADMLIAPSITACDGDEEGIPTCILEAMSCSLPIISTFHSGIPEVVQNGVNGLLVPERNVEALAGAITTLAHSPELRVNLGKQGRKLIEQTRDIRKVNLRVQQIYESLLSTRNKGRGLATTLGSLTGQLFPIPTS